jgi:hypothetical protein
MRTRTRITFAGLVLAAALVGGVAWATIPDAAGVINGCYRTSLDDQKGQLRVVDDPDSCRSNETPIRWNQEGPKGAAGAQGIQGVQGPKGDAGSTGSQGPKGDKGDSGAAGTNGTNGVDGKDGQPGTNGVDGKDGQPGLDGTNGVDGAPGAPGDPCLPTNPACVGPKGDKGEPGEKGDKGDPRQLTVYEVGPSEPGQLVFDDASLGKLELVNKEIEGQGEGAFGDCGWELSNTTPRQLIINASNGGTTGGGIFVNSGDSSFRSMNTAKAPEFLRVQIVADPGAHGAFAMIFSVVAGGDHCVFAITSGVH